MTDHNEKKVAQYLEESQHLKTYYQKRAIKRLINNSTAAANWNGRLSPQFENNIRAFILASVSSGLPTTQLQILITAIDASINIYNNQFEPDYYGNNS